MEPPVTTTTATVQLNGREKVQLPRFAEILSVIALSPVVAYAYLRSKPVVNEAGKLEYQYKGRWVQATFQ